MSNTYPENPNNVEWKDIDWRKVEKYVFKLQRRIYQASERGDKAKVRRLQRTLMRSYSAKLLSVRQITQDNQGKKTAGVDGIKSLTPKQRLELVKNLSLKSKPLPARRIHIPKAKVGKRPLSIPAIKDRAAQALVKLGLEPEWEALFEPNSYGFRPGRSTHDAIEAIYTSINQKQKFVLDADISKCFDTINHDYLLRKLNTSPTVSRIVRAWLKAGWVFKGKKEESDMGTPQGGVISPLLANVALHGMESRLKQFAESLPGKKRDNSRTLTFVRYADDFVVIHPDRQIIEKARSILTDWLKEVGLEISEAKTKVTHTSEGFDFLGFNIRQYSVGKNNSGKNGHGKTLGHKTLIIPSKEKVLKHYRNMAEIINSHNAAPQAALVRILNPIIRGWANYYSTVVSSETFQKLDNLIWLRLKRWCKRRHPNKNASYATDKYFKTVGNQNWVFGDKSSTLINHADIPIIRHIKVRDRKSPYDGDTAYWANRLGKHPELPTRVSKLLKAQKGKCNQCGLMFRDGDIWEVDHIIPRNNGGKNLYSNLQLLHRHCHDVKTAKDIAGCTNDNGQLIEEPCEVKVSRTVLKTSRLGD